ncbi:MAG: nucleoside-diphosphate kinase [Spirochaetaceae bacterium]|jgi:nucleoside diphosphate kinase|nr:nucleoside-diphosphate kinase [Spirochaetaceae bacterium]
MNELSYVLVTPYTVAKSRTGGVIARLLSRAGDLELAGAQMIAPDAEFAESYASSLRQQAKPHPSALADYVVKNLSPFRGKPQRALFLLFRGENACDKLIRVCGHLYPEHRSIDDIGGETIRDTYADIIVSNDPEKFDYFEPAVLTPRNNKDACDDLLIFTKLLKNARNITGSTERANAGTLERTLVIIKPENWYFASARPGEIIDMFSQTGLKIIGVKVFSFTLEQALEFYAPVEGVLKNKLAPIFGMKARELLEHHFSLPLNETIEKNLAESFGAAYAKDQFYQIVDFMSGQRPDRAGVRPAKCMVIVYEGENAVQKIRDVLGPTDPAKAPAGTIRREFGSNVMINAAHASDSTENFVREKNIVQIDENKALSVIEDYLR